MVLVLVDPKMLLPKQILMLVASFSRTFKNCNSHRIQKYSLKMKPGFITLSSKDMLVISNACKKIKIGVFFNASGPLFEIPVPNICTGNGNIYKEHVLSKAAALQCAVVQDFQEKLCHPLTHHTFFHVTSSFAEEKKNLLGYCYDLPSALGSAIFQCLQSVPRNDCFFVFEEWFLRL